MPLFPGSGNSECKGPEAGMCWMCYEDEEEDSVTDGGERGRRCSCRGGRGEVTRALQAMGRVSECILRIIGRMYVFLCSRKGWGDDVC